MAADTGAGIRSGEGADSLGIGRVRSVSKLCHQKYGAGVIRPWQGRKELEGATVCHWDS
jgi:hypothetical protein